MSPVAILVGITAIVWLAVFALFIVALRRRWFARYQSGFLIAMVIALIGVALMSASVVGAWGYGSAKRILERDLITELKDVGDIVENQITQDVGGISKGLTIFAASLAPLLERNAPASETLVWLRAIQSFNPHLLQIAVFDRDGRLLVSTAAGQGEQASRVAIAFSLDGKTYVSDASISPAHKRQVVYIGVPLRSGTGPVLGAVGAWYDLQSELVELVKSARFNESGYAVMVDGEGQIIAHRDVARLNEDISRYPAVRLARQSRTAGSVMALNAKNEMRLFAYRPMPNPSTLASQPWILLTEINANEMVAPLRAVRRELALGLILVLLAGLLVAHQTSRSIQRPLQALGEFAERVGAGDLTGRTDVGGNDVAGRLAASLNDMTRGLAERDHVKEVFGRYIATQVSDKILAGQANLGGESRRVTILFSDIRNFTGMSEQMTPAQIVSFLNDYFSEMVDAVFEHEGMLDKFLGDGLMAVFGAFGDAPDHPRQAVRAALRMRALLGKINGERAMAAKPPIAIGIGIHSDDVVVGNIGSRKRLEFTVVGDGVNVSSRLQGLNKEFGTTILISEATYEAVKDEFECHQMPEAPIRGKTREVRIYEVISVKVAAVV